MFLTVFIKGVGLTGFLCRPWTSGCTDYCLWATRTPWSFACYWSRGNDQAILWTDSKDFLHVFLHGSRRYGAADPTNQGPTRGVDHRKSDSIANVILQPDGIPVLVADAITRIGTAS